MSNRTIFGYPIRKGVTDEFYPDKMDIEKFEEYIVGHFDAYKRNMKNLGSPAIDEKYIEDWVEQYLAWLDIEQE